MSIFFFFFFNDTATTEIYTLSLHDALPISCGWVGNGCCETVDSNLHLRHFSKTTFFELIAVLRSEEHTSELQSRLHLVCRLLLEKKKKTYHTDILAANKSRTIVR